MNAFLDWCGRKVAFAASLLVMIAVLWYFTGVRALFTKVNDPIVAWLVSGMPIAGLVLAPPLHMALLGIEAFIIAILIAMVLRRSPWVVANFFVMSSDGIRYLVLAIAGVSNLLFAAYACSVFWDGYMFGVKMLPGDTPAGNIDFLNGVWLGQVGAWYAVMQALPLFLRPRMSVASALGDLVTSAVPIAITFFALGNFLLSSPSWDWWTPYRQAALALWVPVLVVDLANAAITLRLLTRGFISSEDVIRTGGVH